MSAKRANKGRDFQSVKTRQRQGTAGIALALKHARASQRVKDSVYVPPLPRTLVELRECINAAVMTIDRMLQNVWNELDYPLDVCHVTQGAHTEHL